MENQMPVITMNANQTALYVAYRKEYAKQQREIANIKQFLKDDLESLVEGLGWDKKENKAEIKVLKKSLAAYVKQQAEEQLREAEEVLALVNIGS